MDKAEVVLHKIRDELNNKTPHDAKLSQEFFQLLRFKPEHRKQLINTRRVLTRHADMCQCVRDMINIGEETDWNLRASVQSVYRSMGTFVNCLNERSAYVYYERVQSVEKLLREAYTDRKSRLDVIGVYECVRPNESFGFNRQALTNVRTLFHGSRVNNFVGILSRGLLLPKFVSNENNNELERTDQGTVVK